MSALNRLAAAGFWGVGTAATIIGYDEAAKRGYLGKSASSLVPEVPEHAKSSKKYSQLIQKSVVPVSCGISVFGARLVSNSPIVGISAYVGSISALMLYAKIARLTSLVR